MYFPSLEDVKELAASGSGNVVPVYREVVADLDTPVSAFLKVKRAPTRSCWRAWREASGSRATPSLAPNRTG